MTLNARTKDLLAELADFLDTLPAERFNYRTWVGRDWGGAQDLSCGTTACAAGWAATLPSYQKLGLYLGRDAYWSQGTPAVEAQYGDDDRETLYDMDAMAHVLDITAEDAQLLFQPQFRDYNLGLRSPGDDAPPSEVAAHIRRWLALSEASPRSEEDADRMHDVT